MTWCTFLITHSLWTCYSRWQNTATFFLSSVESIPSAINGVCGLYLSFQHGDSSGLNSHAARSWFIFHGIACCPHLNPSVNIWGHTSAPCVLGYDVNDTTPWTIKQLLGEKIEKYQSTSFSFTQKEYAEERFWCVMAEIHHRIMHCHFFSTS